MNWRSAAAAGLGVAALSREPDLPLSPVFARGRVGADFGERTGLAGERAHSEMDDLDAFARDDFDPGRVHPTIRDFYESTLDYAMWFDVDWHRGFRAGAAGAAHLTRWLEQLNLPGPGADGPWNVESDLRRVPDDADPREDVRLWTRTRTGTGEAVADPAVEPGQTVFVALYGAHETPSGDRLVNVAVPLPGSNLSTVLRPDHLGAGDATGLELTTFAPGQPGLFAVTPAGAFRLPMHQRFRTYPTTSPAAPSTPVADADLVTTQEMWLCGRQFLTVTYGMRRRRQRENERES